MSLVVEKGILTRQPLYPAPLANEDPLLKGLAFAVNPAAGPYDSLSGKTATTWNRAKTATVHGLALHGGGSGQVAEWSYNPILGSNGNVSGGVTFAVLANPFAEARESCLIGVMMNGAPYKQIALYANFDGNLGAAASGTLSVESYNNVNQGYGIASGVLDGKFHVFVGVFRSGVDATLYVDGVNATSSFGAGAGGSGLGDFGTDASSHISVGSEAYNSTTRAVNCDIPFAAGWNRALSASEVARLTERVWRLWQAPTRRLWAIPASGTVALTGQALTSSQGTLAPSTSVALTGQSLTSSQGSLSPSISLTLTGQALTSSQGTLAPSTAVALSGQSLTSSQGTLSANGDVTVALSGQALTSSQGTLAPATAVAVSGQALTASQGTLAPTTSVALSGQTLTSSQGTLSPSATGQSITIQLTGQSLTTAQGSLSLDQYIWDTSQGRAQPGRGTFRPLKPDEMSKPEIVVVEIPEEESTYEHHPVSDVKPVRAGPRAGISSIKLPRPPIATPTTVQDRDYKALMARAGTKTKTMKLSDFPVKQNKKYLTKTRGPVTLKGN